MTAVAAYWVLLALPGYAFLRRFMAGALEAGPFGCITLSYLASCLLLTPVSIAAYAFRWPVYVLSIAIASSIVVALVWLGRELITSRMRLALPTPLGALIFCLVAADLILGLRRGTFFNGDAFYHVARVRMLLAYGFNSWDPMVAKQHFDAVYHTNLYHALMAAAAQLTRTDAPQVWVASLFFAKLVTASATYYLAWSLFGQRWLGWVAAGISVLWLAPYPVLTYPNTVAVYWLMPMALAFTAQVFAGEYGRRPAAGLLATAAMLVQTHGLYFVFAVMIVTPCLLLRWLWLHWKRQPGRAEVALALLALSAGAPWFGVTIAQRMKPAASQSAAPRAAPDTPPASAPAPAPKASTPRSDAHRYEGFVHVANDRIMLDPAGFWDPWGRHFQILCAILLGLCSRRRPQFAALSIALGVVLCVLYVPQICTPLATIAKAPWVIRRLSALLKPVHLAIVPAALLLPLLARMPSVWLQLVFTPLALSYAYCFGSNDAPWTRRAYLAEAKDTRKVSNMLAWHARRHAFFDVNVAKGSIVAAPIRTLGEFNNLLVDCDCYPLAAPRRRGTRGLDEMDQRRSDVDLLLGSNADLKTRVALLRRYRVRQLIFSGRQRLTPRVARVYQPITRGTVQLGGMSLLTVEP